MEVFFGIIIVYGLISILSGNYESDDANTTISHKGNDDRLRTLNYDLEADRARKERENNRD